MKGDETAARCLLLAGGQWIEGEGTTATLLDKYTLQPITDVRAASDAQLDQMIDAAERAFRGGAPSTYMHQYHADGHPELYRLSNLDENGKPNGRHPDKGTLEWHTDGSWQRVTGQATIIYGEVMPQRGEGGETHFCDMYGAYERLDAQWRARIAGLRAVHNLDFSRNRRHGEQPMTDAQRSATPPVDHPVVRTHPETGRKCLYLGDHAEYILGMPYAVGRALIEELNALAVHADLTYEHRWNIRELIVWDNRCVMHRATPYDPVTQGRVIRRCTVLGEVPF
jgi:taurine dioxygenase